MKAYPSFIEWKRDQSPRNQRLIASLIKLVDRTAPKFEKSVKWGQGCWLKNGDPRVYIHAEPDHLHFGFYWGARLKDPKGLLVGNGKQVRHVKIRAGKDIVPGPLRALIRQVL